MTERFDQKQLLDDVLAESSPPDFRTALLGEVLRQARRRRRWRQSRSSAGVLVAIILASWLTWHNRVEKFSTVSSPRQKIPATKGYQLVDTQPFPARAVVATANFANAGTISSSATVVQIATSSTGFRYLDDAQLLELAGPGAAILIRTGPHSEELVFAEGTNVSKPSPEN
jgi:hypothetical protein